jgi:hypothetical protein
MGRKDMAAITGPPIGHVAVHDKSAAHEPDPRASSGLDPGRKAVSDAIGLDEFFER